MGYKKNSTLVREIIENAPRDADDNSIISLHNRRWALELLKAIDAQDEQQEGRRPRGKKKAAKKAPATRPR